MNTAEQNLAIAIAAGYWWTATGSKYEFPYLVPPDATNSFRLPPEQQPKFETIDKSMTGFIPDYVNDLNAIHKAEKTLGYLETLSYMSHLNEIIGRDYVGISPTIHLWHATSKQRAKAFLKAKQLWK